VCCVGVNNSLSLSHTHTHTHTHTQIFRIAKLKDEKMRTTRNGLEVFSCCFLCVSFFFHDDFFLKKRTHIHNTNNKNIKSISCSVYCFLVSIYTSSKQYKLRVTEVHMNMCIICLAGKNSICVICFARKKLHRIYTVLSFQKSLKNLRLF